MNTATPDSLTTQERSEWADEITGADVAACESCKVKPAGDRDSASPFCGTCDPDGIAFFYDVIYGKRQHPRDRVCRVNARRMTNKDALSHAIDWLAQTAWQQGKSEGEAYGAGRYNEHFTAGETQRRAIVIGKIALAKFVEKPNEQTRTALLIAVGW